MTIYQQNSDKIMGILSQNFPNPKSELDFSSPFELLVAVILSAQCTDKRVNIVTKQLFAVANTPELMVQLPLSTVEQIIHPCGFYHNKAKFLLSMSSDIITRFGGVVPDNIDDLRSLAGVGRKTANVVYAVAFGGQAIAVDTHVFRVSNRVGLASAKNVLDTEKQLMELLPQHSWADSHHYILLHGRYVCKAQKPLCHMCSISQYCKHFNSGGEL